MTRIEPTTLQFLSDLAAHNDRQWFADHKVRYEAAQLNVKTFLAELVDRMNEGDGIEHARLYRIYRDVRFSKDKSPYNPRFGMSLSRRKPELRGGYMVNIKPEAATVAAGFWAPNASDMRVIRSHIDSDGERFRAVIDASPIQHVFGKMSGDAVRTAPRGYKNDHPHIDLLRHKQYLYSRTLSASETTAADFLDEVVFTLRAVRPFFDHMSEVLSHDVNGEPLY